MISHIGVAAGRLFAQVDAFNTDEFVSKRPRQNRDADTPRAHSCLHIPVVAA